VTRRNPRKGMLDASGRRSYLRTRADKPSRPSVSRRHPGDDFTPRAAFVTPGSSQDRGPGRESDFGGMAAETPLWHTGQARCDRRPGLQMPPQPSSSNRIDKERTGRLTAASRSRVKGVTRVTTSSDTPRTARVGNAEGSEALGRHSLPRVYCAVCPLPVRGAAVENEWLYAKRIETHQSSTFPSGREGETRPATRAYKWPSDAL